MQTWGEDVLSQVGAVDTMAEARMVDLTSTQVVTSDGACHDYCGSPRITEPWEHSVSLPAGVNPGSVASSLS